MNRRVVWIAVAGVGAAALLGWLLLTGGRPAPRQGQITEELVELPTPTPAPEQRIILLFAGGDGLLHPELRSVPLPKEVGARLRVVMQELLAGPEPEGKLSPVCPYPAEVKTIFLDGEGRAFVDLTPPPKALAGSHTEIMLTYGIVDSILLNCPELTEVQLLFGGAEVSTLTGHLDLSSPLVLNKRFIASS